MAVPKKRTSSARRDKRRTHWKVVPPNLVPCPQCREPKLPHHVCPNCGTYKGRKVLEVEEA
ncbi:MAG: 50S ribosomal protein L32 [Deltaproteobacteria bacterium]|nr:MAG: 50S ribosomal protein L32 [Deltaproteobacteria bacterium]